MEELGESELGSREFWDKRYKEEVHNYQSHGDVGEIWFGEDIVDRIIRWMNKNVTDRTKSILDVGCGNGMLLIELHREGYTNLKGVDYSPDAIALAKAISNKDGSNITYSVLDILNADTDLCKVDIVLDKGTYDAISLSAEAKNNREMYITNIGAFLNDDGVLVITSCNWTEDELRAQFEHKFDYVENIPTPQFKFGGKVGSVVSSIILKKKF